MLAEENRRKAIHRLQDAYAQAQAEKASNTLMRHIEITHDLLTRKLLTKVEPKQNEK